MAGGACSHSSSGTAWPDREGLDDGSNASRARRCGGDPRCPAAFAQAAPSNPARAALAALERQADALFAAAAKRDWTGAKIALDNAKGAVDVLRTQRFEARTRTPAAGWRRACAARHRLDTAVAEADIALGVVARPRCAAPID